MSRPRDGRYDLNMLGGAGASIGDAPVWDGIRWVPASGSSLGVVTFEYDRFPSGTGTLSGSITTAALTYIPKANSCHLYLNGQALDEGTDYTLASNTITLIASVGSGDVLWARYAISAGAAPAPVPPTPTLRWRAEDLGLADNALVTSWTDGRGGITVAAGSGVEPTYKTGVANGHDVVRWSSGKQMYQATAPTVVATDSFTHMAVIAPTTAGNRYLYGFNGTSDIIGLRIDSGFLLGAIDGSTAVAAGSTVLDSAGGFSVVSLVRDLTGGTLKVFVNGVEDDSVVTSGSVTASSGFSIGDDQRSYPSHSFIGDLAELQMYDTALSPADRYAAEQALGVMYGVSV